jgi:hypothetical protein
MLLISWAADSRASCVAADEVEALVAQKTRAGRPLECCRRRSGILTLRPLSNTNSFVNLLPPEIAWTVSGTGRNSAPNAQTLQVGAPIHSPRSAMFGTVAETPTMRSGRSFSLSTLNPCCCWQMLEIDFILQTVASSVAPRVSSAMRWISSTCVVICI